MRSTHRLLGLIALTLTVAAAACSPTRNVPRGGPGGGTPDAGTVNPSSFPAGTFGAMCNGASTTISGIALAPNGKDPVPSAQVYVIDAVSPIKPGVSCDLCGGSVDRPLASVQSGPDGRFTLPIDALPVAGSFKFVVSKGRFRRVGDLPIQPCTADTAPPIASTLPGRSADGDLPRIAVATGDTDHLDVVLAALGIQEFDCYVGSKKGTAAPNTPCSTATVDIATLLADPTKLAAYNMLFLSCAPGKFASLTGQAMAVANLEGWVRAGGRLFSTDESYNFVEQTFPAEIDFYPGTAAAATPQPVDQANLGVGAALKSGGATYMGTIVDSDLQNWLQVVGALTPESNTLSLTGFLNPWSAQKDTGMDVKTEVTAVAAYYTTSATAIGSPSMTATMPMTVGWDYQMCGRVIYSSYHTLATTQQGAALSAQEKILEFLVLDISSCLGPIG